MDDTPHTTTHSLRSRPASPLPTKPANDSSRTVMLWWHLSQVMWRLTRSVPWATLKADDVRRLDAILELLEGEIHLARMEARVSEEGKRGHRVRRVP